MNEFGELLENVDLSEYTTLGIGGIAKYLVKPDNKNKLIDLIKYLNQNHIKYYVLGNGSNVILDDSYFDGVIIKLDNLNKIEIDGTTVTCEAGVMLPKLVNTCLHNNLISLSFASMIPGSVGGSVAGNAGAYGYEIMQYVKNVEVIDKDANVRILTKDEISFGYRYTSLKGKYLILSASFICEKGDATSEMNEIKSRNEKRISSQPIDKKNVGSIFRNPENDSAGRIIDSLGLKGFAVGGAMVSDKHANFIINDNNATFEDVIKLIDIIKQKVNEEYNINLVVEPSIIKWNEL